MRDLESLEMPPWLAGRIGDALTRLRIVRAENCPACASPDSAVAMVCGTRGDDVELDGQPMCRWAEQVQRERLALERYRAREERLQRAGFTDARIVSVIAGATKPPAPSSPGAGFAKMWAAIGEFQQERHRRNLTLVGGTGVGKSVASAWLIAETPYSLLVRAVAVVPDDGWDELRRQSKNMELVVIEDLGLEHEGASGWHARELEGLI